MIFEFLIGLAILLISLFKYFKRQSNYWKDRGVEGPTPIPFFGNLLSGLTSGSRNPVLQIYDWTKKYGKIYGIQEGSRNVLIVSDGNMLHEVFLRKFELFHGRKLYPLASDNQESGYLDLFHADGATWQHLRSFSNPVFTTSNLKRIMPTVINSTQAMINLMEENVGSGEFFDIHKHFQDLTLDILSRLALGQKECQQSHNKNMKKVTDALKGTPNTVFHIAGCIFPFLGSLLRKIRIVRDPTKELLLQLNETVKLREDQYAQGAQEELDEFGNPGPDFIDFFLEAESDKDLDLQGKDFKKSGLKTTKKLSTEEIASQCLSFLLAGCETTSSTLAFTAYCLAKNPESQARVRAEIKEVLGDDELTYEHLAEMELPDYAIREALRLYPVASYANTRQCMQTTIVGNMIIEPGTYIQADVFAVHRDKDLWGDDAEEYNLNRWEFEMAHQADWLSFGIGPRMCVGMRLASMISKVALVNVLRNFDIIASPQIDQMELVGGSVLQPSAVVVQLKGLK